MELQQRQLSGAVDGALASRKAADSARSDDFHTILVVCTRQIGDVLLTTPLIRAAKARWPAARIDVLGFAGTLGMLRGNPDIGALIEVQPGSGWWQSMALIRRLWRRYDLALVTQRSDRAHLYGWVAARTRSGLVSSLRALSWWKRLLLDHALVVDGQDTHIVVEKLHLLDPWCALRAPTAAAAAAAAAAPLHVVPPGAAALPEAVIQRLTGPYAVVHVPSMWRYKQWPTAHFAVVVQGLLDDGLHVVLTGSRAARDRACVADVLGSVMATSAAVVDAAGQLDLPQLATLLAGAALYVGPDTSVTHLAAACGTPSIALFGPTQPQVWGPWPQGRAAGRPWAPRAMAQQAGSIVLMQGPGACVPCSRAGCEDHLDSRADCLEHLSAQDVLAQARRLLAAPHEAGQSLRDDGG